MRRDLEKIPPGKLGIGDILVQGPGHAIIVLDMAKNKSGDKMMLLGQSYMPSQEFHILRNPEDNSSPWYEVQTEGILITPEWKFDVTQDCRRFK